MIRATKVWIIWRRRCRSWNNNKSEDLDFFRLVGYTPTSLQQTSIPAKLGKERQTERERCTEVAFVVVFVGGKGDWGGGGGASSKDRKNVTFLVILIPWSRGTAQNAYCVHSMYEHTSFLSVWVQQRRVLCVYADEYCFWLHHMNSECIQFTQFAENLVSKMQDKLMHL